MLQNKVFARGVALSSQSVLQDKVFARGRALPLVCRILDSYLYFVFIFAEVLVIELYAMAEALQNVVNAAAQAAQAAATAALSLETMAKGKRGQINPIWRS